MEKEFINGYRRMGIDIEPLEDGTVKVTQARLINGYILNQKQLIERGKELYPDAKIIPVAYSLNVDDITIEWIESKMQEFGIKRNDLIKQLAIDRSSLSLSCLANVNCPNLCGQHSLLFLTYELNRDFREHLDSL